MDDRIADSEIVTRILRRDWFDEGKLMHVAFALRNGETYLSVNRYSIDTYDDDVKSFVSNHPAYAFGDDFQDYCCAELHVGEVRDIHVALDEKQVDIDVDVEPRSAHVKSHAGIFTRYENANLKPGTSLEIVKGKPNVAADVVLLKVRMQLMKLSHCQQTRFSLPAAQHE